MRDLNFVLRSKIFVNFDGNFEHPTLSSAALRATQPGSPFGQALLLDNPLLFYIDVRHLNLFPPNLIVGEAQDLGPLLVREDSLVPMRDASIDLVFQGRAVHISIEEPRAEVQPADQAKAESVHFSEAEAEQGKGEMVVKRTMTIDRYLPVPTRLRNYNIL